ncbi:hypothetical protein [Streptomyces sp. NPDC007074]|uniref:hypothetical protein n=1 Tax=Streptomyces sp. NPDC007074 TaxID=3156764 RepID=UPI0033EA99AA
MLSAVAAEFAKKEQPEGRISRAQTMLTRLRQRVDWAKVLQVAAKTSLTLQQPSVDDLTSLINTEPGNEEADATDPPSRGLGPGPAIKEPRPANPTTTPSAAPAADRLPRSTSLPMPDAGP